MRAPAERLYGPGGSCTSRRVTRCGSVAFCLVLLAAFTARAQNAADGKDVYGPCAACHGANGEGGKGGEYPRLAGQPPSFTVDSLKQFQERRRHNLPMFPYTEPRELSERDMKDVAEYLARIELPNKAPEFKPTDSALDRLLALEKVLVVPRVEGDVEKGKATYKAKCAKCHGASGRGRELRGAPLLVGQYPNYLRRQFDAFVKGTRTGKDGDPMNGALEELSAADFTNVLAWLTSVQGEPAGPAED
jgi:cytochrome c553